MVLIHPAEREVFPLVPVPITKEDDAVPAAPDSAGGGFFKDERKPPKHTGTGPKIRPPGRSKPSPPMRESAYRT